jgi:hypothetical protein
VINWGNPSFYALRIVVFLAFVGMGGNLGCRRESAPPEHPLRKQVIGSWMAGRPDRAAAFATLDFKPDGTFIYEFHGGSKPPMKLSGDWIIEDQSIVGQIKLAENAPYKGGDSFPFGEILRVDDNTMKLRKENAVDEYHRSPAATKAAN